LSAGVAMTSKLATALVELERDKVIASIRERIAGGEDPLRILEECRQGMTLVGELYQKGDYYLAELMLSADIFKAATEILEPYLSSARSPDSTGKVVLATLKGDIHDLGKNILAVLLKAQGFEVYDVGIDVPPVKVLETVKQVQPDFVGFSALITTAFEQMKIAAEMLEEAGIRQRVKLMVGGGVTTPQVRDYVGADFQTTDATKGVAYCLDMVKEANR
jgi:methylmalonyl-CoA mutase cobalamin-binding domain/chain